MTSSIELFIPDLREDRGYLADHMGSNVITSAEVYILYVSFLFYFFFFG